MSETAKPLPKDLWFQTKAGGPWHRSNPEQKPYVLGMVEEGLLWGWGWCEKYAAAVKTRRSAPPVADQCARCRAAKAKEGKVTR